MKFLDKLILLCVALFVGVAVSVASAETTKQQKAKQQGLNTASPNQMLTQKLGTELMVKSSKLAVISKKFSSVAPTTTGTYTIGYIPKCSIITTGAYVSVPSTLTQLTTSPTTTTLVGVAVSGVTLLPLAAVASAPVQGAAASATATLASLSNCDQDVPVVMTVSGTVTGGRIDFIVPYIPFNQDL